MEKEKPTKIIIKAKAVCPICNREEEIIIQEEAPICPNDFMQMIIKTK